MDNTKVVGWGPFPLPGEKKRLEKAVKKARAMLDECEAASKRGKSK